MKVGDRVRVRRTEETWNLGISGRIGTIGAERGDGDLVTVELRGGTKFRLCREEVTPIGDDPYETALAFLREPAGRKSLKTS